MAKNSGFVRLEGKNGVPIWLFPMPYVKSVAMGMLVNVGTRDEKPEEAGISHAIEHMLFQGTEEFPDSQILANQIESVGGDLNAWTWHEMTFYYNRLPAQDIEIGFRVLGQMLRRPTFPKDKIPIEMQNVIQEIRRRNDDPSAYVEDLFSGTVYGSHPLNKEILGTEETVVSFTHDSFRRFMARFYHPANFTFIVVGRITAKEVLGLFNRYFPEPINLSANRRTLISQAQPKNQELIISREVEQAHLIFGATTAQATNRLMPALAVFQMMIDGGMSFPLFQEIRDKRGLCYEIRSTNVYWSDLGCFYIYVGTDPRAVNEVIGASIEIIQRSKSSLDLLRRAQKLMIGNLALQNEHTDHILQRVTRWIHRQGKPKSYQELVEEINSITIKEVEEAVNRYLSPERIVKVMLVPKFKKGRS